VHNGCRRKKNITACPKVTNELVKEPATGDGDGSTGFTAKEESDKMIGSDRITNIVMIHVNAHQKTGNE
jgi:hypothetical protein